MSVHLLVLLSLLVVLLLIFVMMAAAWKELQLRAAQTRDTMIERAREEARRGMAPARVSRHMKATARTSRATLFTPKHKRKRIFGRTHPHRPVPSAASGARHPPVG